MNIIQKNIKKIIVAVSIGIAAAIFVVVGLFIRKKMTRLPANACFLNLSLANLNYEETQEIINNKINNKFKREKIKISINGKIYSLSPSAIGAHFDVDEIFKNNKNKNKEDQNIKTPKVKYDKNKLIKFIEELKEKTRKDPTKFTFKKNKKDVVVTAGSPGSEIDTKDLLNKIDNSLQNVDFKTINAKLKDIISEESKINLEEVKKAVFVAVKDASEKIVNHQKVYEKEVVGISLDMAKAKKIVTDLWKGTYTIPLILTEPKVKVSTLQQKEREPIAKDVSKTSTVAALGSGSTSFKTSGSQMVANRNKNIAIAAAAINGRRLHPGEEFSFAATAGSANGYLESITYSQGKKSKGVGGGICQVSSTLFNAAMKAGLKITKRVSHSKPVDYVKKGLDATFDGAGTDFRFINSRKVPIQIQASAGNGSVNISLVGEKLPEENYDVSINAYETSRTASRVTAKTDYVVRLNGEVINSQTFSSSYNLEKN